MGCIPPIKDFLEGLHAMMTMTFSLFLMRLWLDFD
jgi:hypothetical protein